MKLKKILALSIIVLSRFNSFPQTNSDIPGIWKGTSICQIKNSSCHDENVVYHISKGHSSKLFQVVANKIVNGKEEGMGILTFEYNPQNQTLTSIDSASNARWLLNLKGNQIKGTLVYKSNLYRVIDLKKEE